MISSQTALLGPFTLTSLPLVVPVAMPFQQGSDLLVLDIGPVGSLYNPYLTLTLNSDYLVTGGGYDGNNNMLPGAITVSTGGANNVQVNDQILILRNVPINQLTSLLSTGPLTAALIEQALDKQATISQELNQDFTRAVQIPTSESVSMVLPQANTRASHLLGFDSSGALEMYVPSGNSAPGSVTSVNMTVPAFLTISGNPITSAGTLAVGLSGTALPVSSGGTGRSGPWSNGDIPYYTSISSQFTNIGQGTNAVLMQSAPNSTPTFTQTLPNVVQQNITILSTSGNFQVKSLGVGAAPLDTSGGHFNAQTVSPNLDNTLNYNLGAPSLRWGRIYVGPQGIYFGGDGAAADGAVINTTGSAPNETIVIAPNATGTGTISLSANTAVTGLLTPQKGIHGMGNTTPATTGNIGEYLSNEAAAGTTNLVNNTFTNVFGNGVAAITLSPGDWDVGGVAYVLPNAATSNNVACCLVQTNGGSTPNHAVTGLVHNITTSSQQWSIPLPTYQVSVNATTPLYLNVSFRFSAGSATGGGSVWARRSANAG